MDANASNYDDLVLTIITSEYRPHRHAAKMLAKHANASYRTAQAWLSGRNVPSGKHFMNLLTECETLRVEVERLTARNSKGKKWQVSVSMWAGALLVLKAACFPMFGLA